jgi:CitB family two-component system sensor histidine kinase CitS
LETELTDFHLVELIGELLENAFTAASKAENKKVILNIKYSDKGYMIQVVNSDENITQEDVNSLFKIGFTTKKVSGHGLGLYKMKKTVENHHGYIEYLIDNVNSLFTLGVMLPKKAKV